MADAIFDRGVIVSRKINRDIKGIKNKQTQNGKPVELNNNQAFFAVIVLATGILSAYHRTGDRLA